MSSLYSVLQNTAQRYPRRKAIAFYGKEIRYGTLLRYTDALAYVLRKRYDIQAGDVVTVCMPNSPSATVVLYAVNKLGAICNLIHPFAPVAQLKKDIQRTNTKLLILYDVYTLKNDCTELGVPALLSSSCFFMGTLAKLYFKSTNRGIVYNIFPSLEKCFFVRYENFDYYNFAANEDAIYLPSGGTTGEPKIIRHSVDVFNWLCGKAEFFMSLPLTEYKAMYSVLPIFHGYGLCMNVHMCVTYGIINVMSIKFDPKSMARGIAKYKVGVLTGVPTMYARLLKQKAFAQGKISSLVECFVGGDSVSEQLTQEFNNTLKRQGSKGKLLSGYGLTETVTVCAVNTINNNKDLTIGRALPDTHFLIVKDGKILPCGEVGEIAVHSPVQMLGYLGRDDAPTVSLQGKTYLLTGDYGSLDEDGYLYFKQRRSNIIKVNGMGVFPVEIEKVVDAVSGVSRSCAVGVKDDKRGQVVKLYVELNADCSREQVLADIEAQCKSQLIVYAQPKTIEVIDKMPLSLIGKIDRTKLEKLANGEQ